MIMRLIKLTCANPDTKRIYYINADMISLLYINHSTFYGDYTVVVIPDGEYSVIETPDEIETIIANTPNR